MASIFSRRVTGNTELADNLPITVLTVHGNTFVSGLYWQKLDKISNFMSEARQRAKQPEMAGMAIVAIRERDISVQAGFAPQRAGAHKGAYSMASAVAASLGDNFVAAIATEDGRYVFVACHNGAILQSADLVLEREVAEQSVLRTVSRIRRASGEDRSSGDKSAGDLLVYAPSDFGIDAAREATLGEILSPGSLRKDSRLKQLALGGLSEKELRAAVVVAAVSLGAAYAAYFFWDGYQRKAQAERNARLQAEAIAEAKRQAGIQQGPAGAGVPTLPHPWLRTPPVAVFLDMCSHEVAKLSPVLAGWELRSYDCSLGQLHAAYVRDPDSTMVTLNGFRDALRQRFGIDPDSAIINAGNTVSFAAGFKVPDFSVTDGEPPAEAVARWDTISYFQAHAGAVRLERVPPPAAEVSQVGPVGSKPAPTPLQDWTTYKLFLDNTAQSPDFILKSINVETLRILSITMDREPASEQVSWSLQGELYVH